MGDPVDVAWPVPPIATERLVLRPPEARDREGCIQLLCSAEVRRYLGGPLDRAAVEAELPQVPMGHPGVFAVEVGGCFVGTVMVDRRPPQRPGHLSPGGDEVEVSYTFLPEAWGHGYAGEAVRAVLSWAATVLPGEPVVLCTQTANLSSVRLAQRLGFEEVGRFEEFGAEQWFGRRSPSWADPI